MELIVKYMTNNDCYKAGRKITPKGIMVHSLGVPQPDSDVLFNSWNKPNVYKCVHAFVETDRVVQTLPWNYRGWHGAGKTNDTHISFEICEPSGFKYAPNSSTMIGYDAKAQEEYFNKVYKNAIDVCVMLCKEFNLTEKDIICHSEGYKLGIASNHGDVMHWFPKHGKSMDTLRADVGKLLSGTPITPTPIVPTPIKPVVNEKVLSYQKLTVKLGIKDKNGKLLICDGVIGENTQSTYEKMPVLKVGSKGEAVKWIQEVLKANPVDGDFGSITKARVFKFQNDKRLTADAIVGKNTWRLLVES